MKIGRLASTLLFASGLSACASAPPPPPAPLAAHNSLPEISAPVPQISGERMSEITRVLASDEFQGRSMGGSGEEKTVAYLIATAPFVPKSTLWWTLPILAGNAVIVWLWVRATFDDDFVVQRWHGALWLAIIAIGFSSSLSWTSWPVFARTGARLISLLMLVLALSAAAQTVRTWSADLVAGRRRLRSPCRPGSAIRPARLSPHPDSRPAVAC